MNNNPSGKSRLLCFTAVFGFLVLGLGNGACGQVTVINDLVQTPNEVFEAPFVGQAFIDGTGESFFTSATFHLDSAPVAPELEIETRNANGTVGATLYTLPTADSFYAIAAGDVTFTAPTSFELAPNQGYFLVLSDPSATDGVVFWDDTSGTLFYQSGFGIPFGDSTFLSVEDNSVPTGVDGSQYDPLGNDSAQMFDLTVTPAPEPGSAGLLALGAVGLLGWRWRRKRV